MNNLESQRAQLTRKLTELTELRALYLERYGPILADRTRRVEIERKLRSHEKPMIAFAAATQKLALVREEMTKPPDELSEVSPDRAHRIREAKTFHRRSLIEEENRLCRYLVGLQPTVDLVRDLQAEAAALQPEDPLLAELVENVQQEYNVVQEDLRRLGGAS